MKLDLVISVVLYHNSQEQVGKILESIKTNAVKLRLVFVDNTPSGTDFFRKMQLSENVEYRPLSKNVGYGSGHNKVILDESLNANYHLILNPDVHFDPSILQKVVGYLSSHADVGILMPKVVYPSGEDQGLRKLLPTPSDLILRRFLPAPLKRIFGRKAEQYELKHLDPNLPMEVPVLSGCCMFCRRDWLQEIGGFDENFFLYLEDVDLSRRMLAKGKNRYWPQVSIVHEYQMDSYKKGSHLSHHMKSALRYFHKHGWLFDSFRKRTNRKAIGQRQTRAAN